MVISRSEHKAVQKYYSIDRKGVGIHFGISGRFYDGFDKCPHTNRSRFLDSSRDPTLICRVDIVAREIPQGRKSVRSSKKCVLGTLVYVVTLSQVSHSDVCS